MAKIELTKLNTMSNSVVKGAKSAKGADPINGSVMQFSSLMDVMNDDFAVMQSMEQSISEPEAIDRFVPEEFVSNNSVDDKTLKYTNENLPVEEEVSPEQDIESFTVNEIIEVTTNPDKTEDIFSNQSIVGKDIDFLFEDIVQNLEQQIDEVVEDIPVSLPLQILNSDNSIPSVKNTDVFANLPKDVPPTIKQVDNIPAAKDTIIEEVVQLTDPKIIEEVEKSSPISIRRDSYLDTLTRDEVEAVIDEIVELDDLPEIVRSDSQIINHEASVFDEESITQPTKTVNPQITNPNDMIGASVSALRQTTTVTSFDANVTSINNSQQNNDKAQKLPTLHLPKKNFSQLLAEAKDGEPTKMAFSNKLLKRLELVINDPSGTLDVEIAQDPIGIHVKAVMPIDVIRDMIGLEQDLHSALQERGLELGSFQMEEKREDDSVVEQNKTFREDLEDQETDSIDQNAIGGIFINQIV
jgi:hypothetical protein